MKYLHRFPIVRLTLVGLIVCHVVGYGPQFELALLIFGLIFSTVIAYLAWE
jgi:hypothetical protein